MFLPLYDPVRPKRVPFVTWSLGFVCIGVYLVTYWLGTYPADYYLFYYGFIPYLLSADPVEFVSTSLVYTPVTAIFLHGGLLHLVMNLWMLHIVGDNVEGACGHMRYIWLYMVAGLVAGFAHYLSVPREAIPMVGASGAIAGVMGAYLRLFPRRRIVCLWIVWLVPLPAFAVLGFWILEQFLNALSGLHTGVAWWAHVGGFFLGYWMAGRWKPKRSKPAVRVLPLQKVGSGRYR